PVPAEANATDNATDVLQPPGHPTPQVDLPPPPPPQAGDRDHPPSTSDLPDELRAEIVRLNLEVQELRKALAEGSVIDLDDERVLQEVGIYNYHHPLESAALYRDRLDDLQARIAAMVKAGEAILASDMFTYNNSLAKGRKMT